MSQAHARPFFLVPTPTREAAPEIKGVPGWAQERRDDTAAGDLYITPEWVWAWFWERFEPLPATTIYDPATCGFEGWSAGGEWASQHHRHALLADADPLASADLRGRPIARADFLTAPAPRARTSHITNPPFNLFARWWTKAMRESEEVILVLRAGALATRKGRYAEGLHSYWQPAKRMAFELHPLEGLRRLQHNAELQARMRAGELTPAQAKAASLDVFEDPKARTGYRCSPSGIDHGIAVWRPGYTGIPAMIIESTEPRQPTLFGDAGRPKRVSAGDRLMWRRSG